MSKYKNITTSAKFNEIREKEREKYIKKCKNNNTEPVKHCLELIDKCKFKTGYVYYNFHIWEWNKSAKVLNQKFN